MPFGINSFLWTSNFGSRNFALLPEIKSHGFDGLEVTLVRPVDFEATAIRGLQDHALQCTVCSVLPRDLSLIADDSPREAVR